jgi:hypothetical protein
MLHLLILLEVPPGGADNTCITSFNLKHKYKIK